MDARDRIVQLENGRFVVVNQVVVEPDKLVLRGVSVDEFQQQMSPRWDTYEISSSHEKFKDILGWVRNKADGNDIEKIPQQPLVQPGSSIPPHVDPWDVDMIQFPRLLAEIGAVGLTEDQVRHLVTSMELNSQRIYELFGRAKDEFARITKMMAPPTP